MMFGKAIAVAAILLAGAAHASIVTNGSFESPGSFAGSFKTYNAGSTAITGWTVGSGSVDLINSYWQAADGSYSLDMSGGSAGSIWQTISGLLTGKSYILSFALAGNPDRAGVKSLTAEVSGTSGTYTFDSTGKSRSAMGWTTETLGFTASGNSATLRFTSNTNNAYGPALDNVSVALAPVPLPAGAATMGGAFGLLALLRRRRRARA